MSNSDEWDYAVCVIESGIGWGPFGSRSHAELWATMNLGKIEYTILHLTKLQPGTKLHFQRPPPREVPK